MAPNDFIPDPIVGRDMVRLSEQAWVDAHAERRARYERLIKLERR